MDFQPAFTVEGALVQSLVSWDDPGCTGTRLDPVKPQKINLQLPCMVEDGRLHL